MAGPAPASVLSDIQRRSRQLEQRLAEGGFDSERERRRALQDVVRFQETLAGWTKGDARARHEHRAQQYRALLEGSPGGSTTGGHGGVHGGHGEGPDRSPGGERASGSPSTAHEGDEAATFHARAESLIRKTELTWGDIAGLHDTKAEIIGAMRLYFMEKPEGVKLGVTDKFLLYGPPGTGKTLMAMAAANQQGMTFFEVGVNRDLLSKWVGDSPKILSAVYEAAKAHAPSIVFLDEATVLLSQNDQQNEVSTQLHDTFLTILDGFGTKSDRVITIATTNRPWELSEAMRSRFKKHIHVPLPDREARRAIIDLETRGHALHLDLERLTAATEGYSGRDLANLCNDAIQAMVREANPDLTRPGFVPGRLQTLPLHDGHFDAALRRRRPTTKPADLERFRAFMEGDR